MRIVLALSFTLVVLSLILFHRPHKEYIQKNTIPPSNCEGGDFNIKFFGNTNLLFTTAKDTILTDAFFSRPGLIKSLFGKISPNEKRINYGINKAEISTLDAIIPVHSHYDHAMDSPRACELTKGKLIGSQSTRMIGLGHGMEEEKIEVVQDMQIVNFDDMKLQFVESLHWPYPDEKRRKILLNQGIEKPLKSPAKIYDYKEGKSYTLYLEFGNTKIAIQGSAGFKEEPLPDFDADILFLSIAGLAAMDEAFNMEYQEKVIEALNPEIIIPIHWDALFSNLKNDLKPFSRVINMRGMDVKKALEIVKNNNPERKIFLLKAWENYCLQELLNAGNV